MGQFYSLLSMVLAVLHGFDPINHGCMATDRRDHLPLILSKSGYITGVAEKNEVVAENM